jgi:hypothetical protein
MVMKPPVVMLIALVLLVTPSCTTDGTGSSGPASPSSSASPASIQSQLSYIPAEPYRSLILIQDWVAARRDAGLTATSNRAARSATPSEFDEMRRRAFAGMIGVMGRELPKDALFDPVEFDYQLEVGFAELYVGFGNCDSASFEKRAVEVGAERLDVAGQMGFDVTNGEPPGFGAGLLVPGAGVLKIRGEGGDEDDFENLVAGKQVENSLADDHDVTAVLAAADDPIFVSMGTGLAGFRPPPAATPELLEKLGADGPRARFAGAMYTGDARYTVVAIYSSQAAARAAASRTDKVLRTENSLTAERPYAELFDVVRVERKGTVVVTVIDDPDNNVAKAVLLRDMPALW